MTEYGVGNKYGLDLEELWSLVVNTPDTQIIDGNEEQYLEYGATLRKSIEENSTYYDLIDNYGNIVCMDGELCEILEEKQDYLELVEEDTQIRFKLLRRDFEIACMC